MAVELLAIAAVLVLAGLVLLLDLGGAGGALIRGVTSRSLGSLAPGYAASRSGLRVYALLLISLGLIFAGIGVAASSPLAGAAVAAAGLIAFLVSSGLVIAGEVRTYRALGRKS